MNFNSFFNMVVKQGQEKIPNEYFIYFIINNNTYLVFKSS